MIYEVWLNEYKKDLHILYNKLITILKRKKLLYKTYSYEDFCKYIFSKSSKL